MNDNLFMLMSKEETVVSLTKEEDHMTRREQYKKMKVTLGRSQNFTSSLVCKDHSQTGKRPKGV